MDLHAIASTLGECFFVYALFSAICFIAVNPFATRVSTEKITEFVFTLFVAVIPATVTLILKDYPMLTSIYGLATGLFSCFITARFCFAPNNLALFDSRMSTSKATHAANIVACAFLYISVYAISVFLAFSLYCATNIL